MDGVPPLQSGNHKVQGVFSERNVNSMNMVKAYFGLSLFHRNRLVLLHPGPLNLSLKQELFNPPQCGPLMVYAGCRNQNIWMGKGNTQTVSLLVDWATAESEPPSVFTNVSRAALVSANRNGL